MLTRSMFLAAGWFFISFIGLLLFGTRTKGRHYLLSFVWLILVTAIGDAWAWLTFGVPMEIEILSGVILAVGTFFIIKLKNWNAWGQVFWTMTLAVTLLFISYSFSVTAFTPLNTLSFVLAVMFFIIEAIALILALTHTFESLDVLARVHWSRKVDRIPPVPGYYPKVSLHVPTYNEPPEVVRNTLATLAQLDYPNFEVLVVDNNTPEENVWRQLEGICREMGPNFHYLHLDNWPGYKSGALNFALSQTAPDAEIVGTIDSDYQIYPNFLKELIPAFSDPNIAFVQTPQDYRESDKDTYTKATYYSYMYFFNISMPSRNERNAIIFAGTMGLIRKSVLQEIGGWDEWCITEDAEASLRILKHGYKSLFVNKPYGNGLMPFTFDGLKKQRFRWCFGGIQILRKHWESLMPWAHWVNPENKLTPAQQYYYLAGGLQWYTDPFNLMFALFLTMGALFSMFTTRYAIRPLTAPLMIMPAIFLFMHMWRFIWVLRKMLHLSWGMAFKTMYNFFSMGWAVTLASLEGLVQKKGVFLRTPKSRANSRFIQAIQSARWETLIGVACITAGVAGFIDHPGPRTIFLAALLGWQSTLYFAAPAYSLLAAREPAHPIPATAKPIYGGGQPVRESFAAGIAMLAALALVTVAVVAQVAPQPIKPPSYSQFSPPDVSPQRLLGLENVPLQQRALPPTPTPTPLPPTKTPVPVIIPNTGATATPVPPPTDTPVIPPTATPVTPPTATPAIPPTATPVSPPTATPAPTGTPLPTATPLATPTASSTPPPTATSPPTATPIVPPTATIPPLPTATPPLPTVPPLPTATPPPLPTVPPPTATSPPSPTATSPPLPTATAPPPPTATAPPPATATSPPLPTASPATATSSPPTAAPPSPTQAPATSLPPTAAPTLALAANPPATPVQ